MCLSYKQYKHSLRENGDMLLQSMIVGDQFQTVADLMSIPLADYITIVANDCGYGGTAEELIVNYVHLAASQ